MPGKRRTLGAGLWLLAAFHSSAQQSSQAPVAVLSPRRPIALVLGAESAELRKPVADGRQEIREAVKGTLVYPGETIATSAQGAAEIAWCPKDKPAARYVLGANSALLLDDSLDKRTPQGQASEALPFCELPELPPEAALSKRPVAPLVPAPSERPSSKAFPALAAPVRERLDGIDQALASDPQDLLAAVSRATLLANSGEEQEASREFGRVDRILSDIGQGWTKEMRIEMAAGMKSPAPNLSGTYAVVIGISDYPDDKLRLQFARRDAERFREFLLSQRGGALDPANIVFLPDRKADRANVQAAFNRLLSRNAERVIIFASAHGVISAGKAYLVTWDGPLSNNAEKGYPMSELIGLIRLHQKHIGRLELYFDACRLGRPDPISEENRINPAVSTTLDGIPGRRVALFASEGVAYEHHIFDDGKGHGAFTYHLLKGLNDAPAEHRDDSKITLGELIRYLGNSIPNSTRRHQYPAERVSGLSKPDEIASRFLPSLPGIPVGAAGVMPPDAFKPTKGGGADFDKSLDLPNPPGEPWQEDERKSLEILQLYLDGDEIPQRQQDFESGLRFTEEAMRQAPDSPELAARAAFFRGRVLLFRARNDPALYLQAQRELERSIRLDPDVGVAYNALGIAHLEQAQYHRAIDCFQDAVRRSPYWAYPYHNRALALSEMGDTKAAEAAYLNAIRLAPAFSYLPYNLGLLYQRMNRRREARRAFECAAHLIGQRASGGLVTSGSRRKAGCPDGVQPAAPLSVLAGAAKSDDPVRRAAPDLALGMLRKNVEQVRSVVARLDQYRQAEEVKPYLDTVRYDLALLLSGRRDGRDEALRIWETLASQDHAPSRLALAEEFTRRASRMKDKDSRDNLLARAKSQYEVLSLQQPSNAELRRRIQQVEELSKSP
ncbi:MAG: caspase family protein [Bryobacteraceae bacterium]